MLQVTIVQFDRSEEHTSELQSQSNLVCRLLLEKKKTRSRPRRRAEMTRLLLAISTLLLFAPVARPVSADTTPGEGHPRRVTSGTLLWRAGDQGLVPAPALDTRVELRVTGMVARATVHQEF